MSTSRRAQEAGLDYRNKKTSKSSFLARFNHLKLKIAVDFVTNNVKYDDLLTEKVPKIEVDNFVLPGRYLTYLGPRDDGELMSFSLEYGGPIYAPIEEPLSTEVRKHLESLKYSFSNVPSLKEAKVVYFVRRPVIESLRSTDDSKITAESAGCGRLIRIGVVPFNFYGYSSQDVEYWSRIFGQLNYSDDSLYIGDTEVLSGSSDTAFHLVNPMYEECGFMFVHDLFAWCGLFLGDEPIDVQVSDGDLVSWGKYISVCDTCVSLWGGAPPLIHTSFCQLFDTHQRGFTPELLRVAPRVPSSELITTN